MKSYIGTFWWWGDLRGLTDQVDVGRSLGRGWGQPNRGWCPHQPIQLPRLLWESGVNIDMKCQRALLPISRTGLNVSSSPMSDPSQAVLLYSSSQKNKVISNPISLVTSYSLRTTGFSEIDYKIELCEVMAKTGDHWEGLLVKNAGNKEHCPVQ